MERKIVSQNSNQCVYHIQEANISFYFVIPNAPKVNLVLGLFNEIDNLTFQNFPLLGDKAMIIPILNPKVKEGIQQRNPSYFKYLDELLSSLINAGYKILTFNHLEVDKKVYLNQNPEFVGFNQWFINKYAGRIDPITISISKEVKEIKEEPSPVMPNINEFKGEMFRTSEPPQENIPPKETEKIEEKLPIPELEVEPKKEKNGQEPGFVSYVLLGVLSAVVTLIFLYLIL